MAKQLHDLATPQQSGSRHLPAVALLVTAVLQIVAIPFAGFSQGEDGDPAVIPPGGFFAIWGVVVLGCLASAVLGLRGGRAGRSPWRQVQVPLTAVQLLFALWLLAASTLPVLTLPVFVVMLVLLVPALLTSLRAEERLTRYVLGGTLGVYAGWTSAAVWVNAVTLLPGDTLASGSGTAIQLLAIAGATVTACVVTVAAEAWPPYVVASAWALVGVGLSTRAADEPLLFTGAAAGLLAVGLASAAGVARRLRRAPHHHATA